MNEPILNKQQTLANLPTKWPESLLPDIQQQVKRVGAKSWCWSRISQVNITAIYNRTRSKVEAIMSTASKVSTPLIGRIIYPLSFI